MSINAADLPPDVRKKLGLADARKPRTTQRTGPHDYSERQTFTCECGESWHQWAPAQRHANENKHTRLAIDVTRVS